MPVLPFLVLTASLIFSSPVYSDVYKIDNDHTTIGFKIRHLVSWLSGTFNDFDGQIVFDPSDPSAWKADAVIQTASIDTANEKRDEHLRTADFFNVKENPSMTFKSTGFSEVTEKSAKMQGDLTINKVTKPVTLDVEIHGTGKDPWGNERFGATAETTINRKDFNLGWNQALETGQFLVGEEVKITLEIEGIKEQA